MSDRSFLKNIILCDLENTLSDSGHRMHLLNKDNVKFQNEFINDPPNINIINFVNDFYNNNYNVKVIVLSAKREEYRAIAEEWLKKHDVVYDELVMQSNRDKSTPPEYKSKFVKENRNKILLAIDDVWTTCEMIRENHIPVIKVTQCWQCK